MSYQQFAYVYDRLMADMPYPEWIRFAQQCWEQYRTGTPWEEHGQPQTVIDLGCGTGNLTIPLALGGIDLVGIDLSTDMLAMAADKWSGIQNVYNRKGKASPSYMSMGSVRWLHQDMRDFVLDKQVPCIISFCDCLNYLTEMDDVLRTFGQVHNALERGGLFMFDVHTPRLLEAYYDEQPFVYDEEDVAYIWTCDFDARRCEITNELTFFVQQEGVVPPTYTKFVETHIQRAYDLDWIKQALQQSGLTVLACVADFTWDEADAATERAFLVARKEG